MVTLPTPAELIAGITSWASPMFTEVLPLAYYAIGLFAVACILLFMINSVERALEKMAFNRQIEDDLGQYQDVRKKIGW